MSSGGDNEGYWVERHAKLRGKLAAVGHVASSEERNIELYAIKKREIVALLRDLRAVDLTGRSALDAGCGTGMVSELLYVLGAEVSGVDASPLAIAEAQHRAPGGRFETGSLLDFDLKAQFDLVCCIDVLYHVVDDGNWGLALERLAAHLAPGARLILRDQLKAEPESPADHVRFRTRAMYDAQLAQLGLRECTPDGHPEMLVYERARAS